jgi:hypothetical protein
MLPNPTKYKLSSGGPNTISVGRFRAFWRLRYAGPGRSLSAKVCISLVFKSTRRTRNPLGITFTPVVTGAKYLRQHAIRQATRRAAIVKGAMQRIRVAVD